MASKIEPRSSFLYPLNGNNNKLPKNTDKKASVVANQASEKNGTTWYVEAPPAQNEKPPVTKRLSPDRVNIISAALKTSQTKEKPTPPPRTRLSPETEHPKIDNQEKVFGPDLLSAVINAKNALNPLGKKIPPTPLPRATATHLSSTSGRSNTENPVKNTLPLSKENKPKIEPIFVPIPIVPTLIPKRRVSFQTEAVTKDPETNSPETPNTLPISVLKKTPSFNNVEEPTEPKKEVLNDPWADMEKMFSECLEYLDSHTQPKI